jgi:glycosyltransferase involved in cell wall biosynthesis
MDRIIADSQSTRDDLIELLGIPIERMAVVYPGVESSFRRVEDREALARVRARYGLPERYLLFVGTIEPRKNVERLIEAYSIARGERPDAPALAIVGGRGKNADRVDRAVERFEVSETVVFTDYVDHADLPALYSGADLLVLPSLYEGFGLPILEAMACGVMVVASETTSLPELVGDRGILVDPMRPSRIAAGIVRGLSDAPFRAECIRRGLAFAREMTWERCARRTLAVYEEAAASHPHP